MGHRNGRQQETASLKYKSQDNTWQGKFTHDCESRPWIFRGSVTCTVTTEKTGSRVKCPVNRKVHSGLQCFDITLKTAFSVFYKLSTQWLSPTKILTSHWKETYWYTIQSTVTEKQYHLENSIKFFNPQQSRFCLTPENCKHRLLELALWVTHKKASKLFLQDALMRLLKIFKRHPQYTQKPPHFVTVGYRTTAIYIHYLWFHQSWSPKNSP